MTGRSNTGLLGAILTTGLVAAVMAVTSIWCPAAAAGGCWSQHTPDRPGWAAPPFDIPYPGYFFTRTLLRIEPIFSTSHTHSSPSLRNTGGLREKPTPNGVPVGIRSPGSSVVPCEA